MSQAHASSAHTVSVASSRRGRPGLPGLPGLVRAQTAMNRQDSRLRAAEGAVGAAWRQARHELKSKNPLLRRHAVVARRGGTQARRHGLGVGTVADDETRRFRRAATQLGMRACLSRLVRACALSGEERASVACACAMACACAVSCRQRHALPNLVAKLPPWFAPAAHSSHEPAALLPCRPCIGGLERTHGSTPHATHGSTPHATHGSTPHATHGSTPHATHGSTAVGGTDDADARLHAPHAMLLLPRVAMPAARRRRLITREGCGGACRVQREVQMMAARLTVTRHAPCGAARGALTRYA
jgi:hypothetical protein